MSPTGNRWLAATLFQPAAQFHASASRHGITYKKIKPHKPVKMIDGRPWYFLKYEEELAGRIKNREIVSNIKNLKVEHYKVPTRQAWVYSLDTREPKGIVQLDNTIWNQELRKDIVHRVVRYHRARMRQGTHKQKGRAEVRGGGRKPRPQKGSGRARMGSIRSPLCRGGGKALPRYPRDYSFKLPIKVLSKSLQICLTAKFEEGNLFVVENTDMVTHKTKELVSTLDKNWKLYDHEEEMWQRLCFITGAGELDPNTALAARNMKSVDFFPAKSANTWDTIRRDVVFITLQGLKELEERLHKPFLSWRINFINDTLPKQSKGLPEILPPLTAHEKKQLKPQVPRKLDISRPWLLKIDPVTGEKYNPKDRRPAWRTMKPTQTRARGR